MTAIFTLPDLMIWGAIGAGFVWCHYRLKRLEREIDQ